jgi:hypothetical protein
MIIVLSGRRVDQEDAHIPRFPKVNEELVRDQIRAMLEQRQPDTVVASAAAGADLIGLEEAGEQGILRRIILPHEAEYFRAQSVADRGDQWGRRFDTVLSQVEPEGGLLVHLPESENEPDQEAYLRAVRDMFDESLALAAQELENEGVEGASPASRVVAVVIWDGTSRGEQDLSAAFIAEAEARGISVEHISTL